MYELCCGGVGVLLLDTHLADARAHEEPRVGAAVTHVEGFDFENLAHVAFACELEPGLAREFDFDAAKQVIENGIGEAQSVLEDPAKMDALLDSLKEKAADLPGTVTGALVQIPTLAAMAKSFVTKEYTEVPVKTIASVVAALLYLVKGKDLIPDGLPLVGLVDDLAVVTAVIKLNEPEIEAYKNWKQLKESSPQAI